MSRFSPGLRWWFGWWVFVFVFVLVSVYRSAPARAQSLEPPRGRQGYYVGVGGLGVVSRTWESGDGRAAVQGRGAAGTLRLGQMVDRRLGFGLQIDMGNSSGGGQRATLGGLSIAGQLELASNLALHAGVGIGFVSLDDTRVSDDDARGGGGAYYLLGLSYDWFPLRRRLTGGWSVGPNLQLRAIPGDDVTTAAVFLGIDVLHWSGLPRNQLDLPVGEAYQGRD